MSVQRHVYEASSSTNPLSHQLGDLEGNLASLQISIETRLREIELKETQVNDRLRELESREREIRSLRTNVTELDCVQGSKKLQSLLVESASEAERLSERVRRALGDSEDPGKLVLGAVEELCNEDAKLGVIGKRGSVVLLEQLASVAPRIGPAEKAKAARIAREWRAKIREEVHCGVLEVMGFLLLVGAFDLVDEFDSGEICGVLGRIGWQKRRPRGGEDSSFELGGADHDPVPDSASTIPVSPPKNKRSLEEDLELVNQIASAFTSTFDALKCFCVGMDGKNLKLFLYQYIEEHDSWSSEVRDALSHAPDPAKLVLDAIPGFIRSQAEFNKHLTMAKVRKSCILLMEQLIAISPPISPNVREEAVKIANEWGSKLGQIYQRPVTVYGFLLFLASYRLGSMHDADELLRLLGIASQYKACPGLCRALGLADKVAVVIESLIQKTMLLEAVDNVYAYGLLEKFQPVRLLKGYLTYSRKRIYKKGEISSVQQKQAITKEIAAIRTVINYIAKYKLESAYPPQKLEKQILQLEKKKGEIKDSAVLKIKVRIPSASSVNTSIDSQVKVEPSSKKDLHSDGQVVNSELSPEEELHLESDVTKTEKSSKADSNVGNQAPLPSASPWPQLESFCINMYGYGSNFFPPNPMEGPNSVVCSSFSPWPELKSFCVNMDGKGLRIFVYDHVDEKESFCSAVYDALKCASDPAKLVLDAMPGCLRTQPEFDKSLTMKKVRHSRILLLEQLIKISPQISPLVKEGALKMAIEWRSNLGFKFKSSDNVYGFLQFIAAYDLVSNFKEEELLDLLGPANQYKPSPDLCCRLGFTEKPLVVIHNLIEMSLMIEAIEHIYAFEVVDKFSPVLLLKLYLNSNKICKDGSKPPSKKAIKQAIGALRRSINCVAKYKLESELPPQELERQISELEK